MADEDVATERAEVKTYVPAYQKAEWQAHAADLDMSQSEFVRTMVQAGRHGFALEPPEAEQSGADPQGEGLETRVLEILQREGPTDWAELEELLTADIEARLDEALDELQAENAIKYSGRDGGYTLAGDTE
ncbi:MAG: DUF5805 domain-containing protein [Haloarculaceae archaeon]